MTRIKTEDSRISREEMVELFGDEMPIEAVNLLWGSDGSKTCGELRTELRQIAKERATRIKTEDVVERLWYLHRRGLSYASDKPAVNLLLADLSEGLKLAADTIERLREENARAWPADAIFQFGEAVQKKGRASWRGTVVGWYRTELTELGFAVESLFEPGSVQIYPQTALEPRAALTPSVDET
jgi:hypothetical protein